MMPDSFVVKHSTRGATNYLRGAAIMFIMFSHFTQSFQPAFYQKYLFDYASLTVAIFFIVSGYGLFFSLEKRFSSHRSAAAVLKDFYFDRVMRILVPYWVAIILLSLLPQFGFLRSFELIRQVLLLPSPVLWFIPAIIECYIVAPFLYLFLKKLGAWKFAAIFITIFVILLAVTSRFLLGDPITNPLIAYRFLPFGNIVMFTAGMLIPLFVSRFGLYIKNWPVIAGSMAIFYFAMNNGHTGVQMYPVYLAGGFLLCASLTARRPWLPFMKIISIFGRNSLSFYFYQYHYFLLLAYLGLVYAGSRSGVFYVILLSPLFVAFCVSMEYSMTQLHRYVCKRQNKPLATNALKTQTLESS